MSNKNDSLGERMKNNYENRAKTYLVRRMPVIIRLDGKAFHTFTKGFKKPYDEVFHKTMNETMKYLCENIQGCKLGYTQSDEISLLLTDYNTLTTDAWFNNNVQKICSVTASMATMAFNTYFYMNACKSYNHSLVSYITGTGEEHFRSIFIYPYYNKLFQAVFDSRCFNIPEDEIVNYFIWRQQDATRNAIQMLGQCNFSHKELQGKSCNDIQDLLMIQKEINFNDMPIEFKRGVCCKKLNNSGWSIDNEPPIFTQQRDYIGDTFKEKYL